MNIKNNIWQYATAAVGILIMLNPEFAELALFIDAIGLEMFFMLIEVQFIAISGALLNTKIKPIYNHLAALYLRNYSAGSWRLIKSEPTLILLSTPEPVFFMNLLVITVICLSMLNVYL